LLILDNCEHLLDACADVADRILARCHRVSVLATSREALDVEGEQSSRVPSLSLPEDVRDAETSEAVTLFAIRASTVRPDFELNPRNLTAVTEICRRLDGIPLAIEFAASRVTHLSPQEIAARLNDVFRLLTGGRRRVQRQNTLEAALDWSYQLLSDTERTLLRRLSVFAGTFSIDAAESVCSDESVPSHEVLDLIGSLVAKSLLTIEAIEDQTRYRLIETVRQYAATKLRDADEAAMFRTRHRDYFQAWVESVGWERVLITVVDLDFVPEWSKEGANLRSALEWSDSEGRPDLVVAMASRLRQLWYYGGSIEEGLRWLTHARPEDLDISIEERVSALTVGQICALLVSDPVAGELGERAVEAGAGTVSVPYCAALSWRGISRALRSVATGDAGLAEAAIADGEAGLRMAEALGQTLLVSQALSYAGDTLLILGDIEGAEDFLWRAFEIAPTRPLVGYQAAAASHLLGHHEKAFKAIEYGLPDERSPGRVSLIFASYVTVEALARAGVGEVDAARKRLSDFLQEVKGSGYFGAVEQVVLGFAALAHIEGDSRHASRLLGWVGSRTLDVGRYMPSATSPPIYVHYVKVVREALDGDEARRLRAEGRAMSEEEVIALALAAAQA
jgi:predicted ATPase